jgi:hypothetical protein
MPRTIAIPAGAALACLVLWAATPAPAAADAIILKTGRVIQTEKVWEEEDQVKCLLYGSIVGYPKDRVASVETGLPPAPSLPGAPPAGKAPDGPALMEAPALAPGDQTIQATFDNADLSEVLAVLSAVSGKDFIVEEGVTGKVSLKLVTPTPWEDVLRKVLTDNGLGMIHDGQTVRVATLKSLGWDSPAVPAANAAAPPGHMDGKNLAALARAYSKGANSLLEYRTFIDLKETGKPRDVDKMRRAWEMYFRFFTAGFPGGNTLTDKYRDLRERTLNKAAGDLAEAKKKTLDEARLLEMRASLARGKALKYECDNLIEQKKLDIPILTVE